MMEDKKEKIEKFDGKNFRWWKMQMGGYLYQKYLYLPLTEEKENDRWGVGIVGKEGYGIDPVVFDKAVGLQHLQGEENFKFGLNIGKVLCKTIYFKWVFLVEKFDYFEDVWWLFYCKSFE